MYIMEFNNYNLDSNFYIEYNTPSQYEICNQNRISSSDSTSSLNSNKKINILNNNHIKKKPSKNIFKKKYSNNENNENNNLQYDKIYDDNKNKLLKFNNLNNHKNITNEIINNWYILFQKYKFYYQLILDKNARFFNYLSFLSIFLIIILGLLSAFKMSVNTNDNPSTGSFQKSGTAVSMVLEFFIAFIMAYSKKYNNNERTRHIEQYIFNLNIFIGEIHAQLINYNLYKNNNNKFIKLHINKYTKLIIKKPILSISETEYCDKEYKKHYASLC